MKKEVYLTILFDYYESLLTDSDKDFFKDYYFANLSLGEISENRKISRAAAHKRIKKVEDLLEIYENKLKLYEKENEILTIIKDEETRLLVKEILNN